MDTLTQEQRTRCMSRIKSKNTKPEIIVRKVLTKLGYRYRLHVKILPGKPDIVFSKRKLVIFINGCFWHQHQGCKRQSLPKTNTEYWHNKLQRNIEKQKKDIDELISLKWKVTIIWECDTRNEEVLTTSLKEVLRG